jgi:DNA-binding transcriptional ArsR family regulator
MVYSSSVALDATFGALSDPTRRAIVMKLARGERSIGELAAQFDMTLPGVSKHVRVLERAGLAHIRRDGRVRRCRLVGAPLRTATAWMLKYQAYWEQQLDQFAAFLAVTDEEDSAWPVPKPPAAPSPTTTPLSSADASPPASTVRSTRGRTRRR